MGSGQNLREATVEDAAGIHALAGELADAVGDAHPDEGEVRARLEELLEEPRARVFVVEVGDELAGVASVWVKPDLAHGDAAVEIPMLVVAGEHRRAGIGKLLMSRVQKIAAEHDAAVIELVATRANVVAQDFYRSLGFVEASVVSLEFVGDNGDPPKEA